jgi:hypothetical protein
LSWTQFREKDLQTAILREIEAFVPEQSYSGLLHKFRGSANVLSLAALLFPDDLPADLPVACRPVRSHLDSVLGTGICLELFEADGASRVHVPNATPDAFEHPCFLGDLSKLLVGDGVLDDQLGLAVDVENKGFTRLFHRHQTKPGPLALLVDFEGG